MNIFNWLKKPKTDPDPAPGEIWVDEYMAGSPWPDPKDTTKILDVKDGYVKHLPHGRKTHSVSTLSQFKRWHVKVKE